MKTQKLLLTCVLLSCVLFSCRVYEKPELYPVSLYKITQENIRVEAFREEPVIWTAEIELNVKSLRDNKIPNLNIMLEDKKETIITRGYSKEAEGITKWHGKIKDSPGSLVMFVITKNSIAAGNITLASGEFYKIRYLKDGKYALAKIAREKYPPDAPEIKIKEEIPIEMDPCTDTDPADSIDIMVLYTDDARAASGSTDSILSEIYLAVEETNMAYINSNITQRINLVYTAEVSYAETTNYLTDIEALRSTSDGTLDNIHTLRDNHSADIVVLILENIGPCGAAYVMETVSTAFETNAFAVVDRGCATGVYSFAHELGHVMGARHDCDNTPALLPYDYAHGYYNTDPTPAGQANWRTVMSYDPTPHAERICYFSNPGITYPPGAPDGDPMGTVAAAGTCQADNHKTLNNTALTVANFRCTSSTTDNVWMKDTWNDTGKEPDPATASESMCRSPYVWVRKTRDINLVHHHQHENPVTGSGVTNWVYVKLHNGGNACSGDIEVYYADASISLSWPTGWTLIGKKSLTIPADSTRIAELKWINLPASGGHYCLIARWNSTADPMHTPEGTDIGTNVRQNNNIIWKNITIVDAPSGGPPKAAFFQFGKIGKNSFIRLKCNDEYPNEAFTKYGNITLEFDKKSQMLLKNWRSDSPETDMVRKGNVFIIKGSKVDMKKLPFDKEHRGTVKITFQTSGKTPKKIYHVAVSHMTYIRGKESEIGGVAFEIDTQLK